MSCAIEFYSAFRMRTWESMTNICKQICGSVKNAKRSASWFPIKSRSKTLPSGNGRLYPALLRLQWVRHSLPQHNQQRSRDTEITDASGTIIYTFCFVILVDNNTFLTSGFPEILPGLYLVRILEMKARVRLKVVPFAYRMIDMQAWCSITIALF